MEDSILQSDSWLLDLAVGVLVFALVAIALVFLCYYMLYPFFSTVEETLRRWIVRKKEEHQQRMQRDDNTFTGELSSFAKEHSLVRVQTVQADFAAHSIGDAMAQQCKQMHEEIGAVAKLQREIEHTLGQLKEAIAKLVKSYQQFTLVQAELPSIISHELSKRGNTFVLVVLGILLVGLITVNTGLLSRILVEHGIVPERYKLLGVPLSYVFAILLTLVEAGTGAAFDSLRNQAKEESGKPLRAFLMLPIILVLAGIEGYFYSRIGDDKSTVHLPLFGTLPESDIYFLWGMALVIVLAILGNSVFSTGMKVFKGYSLRRFNALVERFLERSGKIEKTFGMVQENIASLSDRLQAVGIDVSDLEAKAGDLVGLIGGIEQSAPQKAELVSQQLSLQDVRSIVTKVVIWIFAGFGLIVIGLPLLFFVFSAFFSDRLIVIGVALGVAVLSGLIGHQLGKVHAKVYVGTKNSEQHIELIESPRLTIIAGLMLIAVFAITAFVLLQSLPIELVVLTAVMCSLIAVVGWQISRHEEFLRLGLRKSGILLRMVIRWVQLAIVTVFHGMILVGKYVVYMFALPLSSTAETKQSSA
jgi:archaellum component FlaC